VHHRAVFIRGPQDGLVLYSDEQPPPSIELAHPCPSRGTAFYDLTDFAAADDGLDTWVFTHRSATRARS
jgi:hypothetical protein